MDLIILFLSIIITSISFSTATNTLSMELIHRHDQFSTHPSKNRLLDRLESDIMQVNALSSAQSASGPVSSGLALGRLEHVVSVSIGTPPKQVNLALDTASSVTWLQCRPCKNCYNQTDPTFDPSKSSSFSPLQCGDPLCKQLNGSDSSDCSRNTNPCLYNQTYDEGWFTSGQFSTETLTFGNSSVVEKVALGCGHDNEGPFDESDGILALGQGGLSFPTQTGDRFGKKFSYCISSLTADHASNSSSIEFGDSAVPPEANFTRILPNPGYYVGVNGFSVRGIRVRGINSSVFEMKGDTGGVALDALTALSWVTRPAYEPLRDAFRRAFDNNNVLIDTPYGLDTCYNLTGMEDSVSVPTVKLHFDGADVELPVENYFILMDNNRTYCLGFGVNGNSSLSIFGNIVQQGFRVSFDLEKYLLGFTANAC